MVGTPERASCEQLYWFFAPRSRLLPTSRRMLCPGLRGIFRRSAHQDRERLLLAGAEDLEDQFVPGFALAKAFAQLGQRCHGCSTQAADLIPAAQASPVGGPAGHDR